MRGRIAARAHASQQARDDRHVADTALMRKQRARPMTAMSSPAMAGPTMRVPLKTALLSATALAMSSRPTISTTNDWRMGMSNALTMPSRAPATMTCQTCTWPMQHQQAEHQGEQRAARLGARSAPVRLGSASASDAAEQPQDQHRQELRGGDHAQRHRIVGQLQHQPALGDRCIQVPDERHQLPGLEQPEVAVTRRRQPPDGSPVRVGWSCAAVASAGHSPVTVGATRQSR